VDDLLPPSRRDLARQGDRQDGRDVAAHVLTRPPDVREAAPPPERDLALRHRNVHLAELGDRDGHRAVDRQGLGEAREELVRAVHDLTPLLSGAGRGG
jgi:hypothetical protein